MTSTIARTNSSELNMTVTLPRIDLAPVQSSEEMEATLIDHASHCRHCLAMVLFREETLAEVGCKKYKRLLASFKSLIEARATVERSNAHIAGNLLEEYCFNRLSEEDSRKVEQHIGVCSSCAESLDCRLVLVARIRGALRLSAQSDTAESLARRYRQEDAGCRTMTVHA